MRKYTGFYIDGKWLDEQGTSNIEVINPSTGEVAGVISEGTEKQVSNAVEAAKCAFVSFSQTSVNERLELLKAITNEYKQREAEIAAAISEEMGAPDWLASQYQAAMGLAHLNTTIEALSKFPFEEQKGTTRILREPIGVCGFITPWNWPINQVVVKVLPALATGCTMVLKPAAQTPFSAWLLTEIFDKAGVPAGVFNLVNGHGGKVGSALSCHPDIDMISFTGSTGAGISVAVDAAPTVKRVHQELGGKSANIILDDADIAQAVDNGVKAIMMNTGQTCTAPTRMLIHESKYEEAVEQARKTAEIITVGVPSSNSYMGPLSSKKQFDTVQKYIQIGIDEGAKIVAGGLGSPKGLEKGFFAKPTIFANVTNSMRIAQEEIFGPVLVMIPYSNEEEAIAIANDSPFGLAGYVQSSSIERARKVASKIRAGQIYLNYAPLDFEAPFGGYKQSGNGREWGEQALYEFVEIKAVVGFG
ncbi:aldehyde dehydrogenase family protein [Acinetobacter nosocomialis]|uniref:aldehyde dehydrogenase family protein n=1 Tax=Acinetobacter nosocomialis TaxID=106654 RepID=UPI000A3502F7|nr:aldehyde dehydrogenase family protein [Acinetobacter nosocomialis]OTL12584.1 aldehyde dehydrogenase family protein [Acinetobacter nosocomialis]